MLPSMRRVPKENLSKCIRASSCRCVQALFFEVTARKADQRCSTSRLPQCCGQAVFSASCSAMVRMFEKVFFAGVADELKWGIDTSHGFRMVMAGFWFRDWSRFNTDRPRHAYHLSPHAPESKFDVHCWRMAATIEKI